MKLLVSRGNVTPIFAKSGWFHLETKNNMALNEVLSAPSVGNVAEVEHDLLRLGNRPAVTPMQLCEADEVFVCTKEIQLCKDD